MRPFPPMWLLAQLILLSVPLAGEAQTDPTRVGVVAGYVSNEQIWKPSAQTERVAGVILGAFVNAATRAGWLSVYLDGTWTQRGGDVSGALQGQPLTGGLRFDFLSISLRPRVTTAFGRGRLFLSAGPVVDQVIRVRKDPGLTQQLENDVATSFGVGLGAGLGAVVTDRLAVEVEARLFEGLGDASSGPFLSVRNRSLELVTRVGIVRPGR